MTKRQDLSIQGLDNAGFFEDRTDQNGQLGLSNHEKDYEERTTPTKTSAILSGLQYKVDENPPPLMTVFLGFQHYLMLLSSNLATPGIMAGIICATGTDVDMSVRTVLMGNMIFACGMCTLIQTFFGVRLPIVQCPAFAYIVPMIALTKIEGCPGVPSTNTTSDMLNDSAPIGTTESMSSSASESTYIERMNLLTGSIMVACVFEIIIGATGLVSILLRIIGPLTVAPTIMLMGLSMAEEGFNLAGKHWLISGGTLVLIILFSEVIPTFKIRKPFQKDGDEQMEVVLHKVFSVILSTCIMWLLCFILTVSGAFPSLDEEGKYGYEARTDLRLDVIEKSAWIRFPYPGYWGAPTFSAGMFVAMVAGVITSTIESIGDYYTCARLAGALPPPPSAVNRGILIEGIDCILAAAVGTGFGVTSCSQNIGVISLTKVGSRRVVLVAGLIMMVSGCLSKVNAVVVSMPDPIIGASLLILFGVLAAVGASNLQYVDLNSSRNLVVFGVSLFMGLSFPNWVIANAHLIKTGYASLDQVCNALLANNMFMGCFTALVLDNVIPGTNEERGILIWRETPDDADEASPTGLTLKTYDFPFGMNFLRKRKWAQYVPFLPTFNEEVTLPCCRSRAGQTYDVSDDNNAMKSRGYEQGTILSRRNVDKNSNTPV